jgi:tryptophan synthase alpha chain
MVAPSTPTARIAQLDAAADAFLYVTGHQGITGADSKQIAASQSPVARVRECAKNPICLGFGVKSPEGIRAAFEAGASIAVVGSHLALAIEEAVKKGADSSGVVTRFTAALVPLIKAPA